MNTPSITFLLYCEITKNDENVNEPILERGKIALVSEMEIFSKFRFYSCPDPTDLAKSSKNETTQNPLKMNQLFKGSGHE